ncbi:MAG: hypothetical protein B7Y81_04260 [Caulobacter sp. 32-67-35]|nr:MAG: hypothetical protein B7Y81_04260 [Caulobacter sp. 32-67-35]
MELQTFSPTASTMANLEAALAGLNTPRAPSASVYKPVTMAQAVAARADLAARARSVKTVMLRDARGRFTGAVKVTMYGGANAEAAAEMLTSAMMAKLFPRWKGDATDPAVARAPKRGPAPNAARALVLA